MSSPISTSNSETRPNLNLAAFLGQIALLLDKMIIPINSKISIISYLIAGILSIPIVCDVLARFLFKKSIPGIIELQEFALILIVFLALPLVETKKKILRLKYFILDCQSGYSMF